MKNRIRNYRQRRGMTLKELADTVSTTPQSVSRLETGNMTLSTEWLERFAEALQVHPVDLLEGPGERDVEMLGVVAEDGRVRSTRQRSFPIDIPADNAVAVKLDGDCGSYRAGEVLIGERLSGDDIRNASGRDCLVKTTSGIVVLRRVLASSSSAMAVNQSGFNTSVSNRVTLVPLDQPSPGRSVDVAYDIEIQWAAKLIMRLSYI